jgi:hypothetical protein
MVRLKKSRQGPLPKLGPLADVDHLGLAGGDQYALPRVDVSHGIPATGLLNTLQSACPF